MQGIAGPVRGMGVDIEPSRQLAPPPGARTQVVASPNVDRIEDDFSEFYRLEHDGQVRRAFLLLGASGPAHDVVADAFVAVLRRWDSIDAPGPYLNRCVLNGCRDLKRRPSREHPTTDRELTVLSIVPDESGTELTAGTEDELARHLLALPFRQRAAIVFRYYGGYRETEIAELLDCRPGTVGSLIHRGMKTLRHSLTTAVDQDTGDER